MGGKVSSPSQDGKHYGRSSGKLPTDLARDPAVPLLRGHLKEEPSVSGKETRHPRIPAVLSIKHITGDVDYPFLGRMGLNMSHHKSRFKLGLLASKHLFTC